MADVIWSDDGDLFAIDPNCFAALSKHLKHLVEGSDGATDSTGKVFTSSAVGSAFVSSGVGKDGEDADCTHFLEIKDGNYKGFYKIATAAAASLTLDRQIGASLSDLNFRVRTFGDMHDDAHDWLQGEVIKREDDEEWNDEELHPIDKRKFKKICAYHVLAEAFMGASMKKGDILWEKSLVYRQERDRRWSTLGRIWKDTDSDDEKDETTDYAFGGSVEMRIS